MERISNVRIRNLAFASGQQQGAHFPRFPP
jgi:hypothetical protein